MKEILIAGGIVFVAIYGMGQIANAIRPYDATDPPGGRSGMRLTTDFGTGCQYLSAPAGGITPRVDANGRHIGCAP